jgi:hypothetical protein
VNSSRGARRGLSARALRLWLIVSIGPAIAVSQRAAAQSASAQAASSTFWVEREGDTIRATVDLRPLCEADVRRRLGSGPQADLKLGLALREHGTEVVRGRIMRVASVRWDAFRDRLLGSVRTESGQFDGEWVSVDAFLDTWMRFDAAPIASGIPLDETVYRLDARLEVNPTSEELRARLRAWLTAPPSAPDASLGRRLLSPFIALSEDLAAGRADRIRKASGHPFRGDRLPLWGAQSPPPP